MLKGRVSFRIPEETKQFLVDHIEEHGKRISLSDIMRELVYCGMLFKLQQRKERENQKENTNV